ncbi:LbtU family siderophore porin [Ectothiorhodospira shaposhnikovii]|uniref:LbtU family siderophore porin n=1 Tax=Ectothiorhodospira shaposhnikovii TaxID=1054 RepID=UPI001EE7D268|nr:LbtU family siderophore porin [Ectothiorhodospira shaposhnikovii]MCG5512440.1 LbtU family siderophore porin [Ectothiorhodospira shaposhnikovii]
MKSEIIMRGGQNKLARGVALALGGALAVTVTSAQAQMPELTWSGLLEIEANWAEDYEGGSGSDLNLATVELGLEARFNELLSARVLLLYEDDGEDSEVEVDEAVISLGLPAMPGAYLEVGRQYVPFGRFETALVSDPLALELAETRETAALLGWESDQFYGAAWVFSGDTRDNLNGVGLNLGMLFDAGPVEMDLGVAYTSTLGDSDTLQEVEAVVEGKRVGGYNAYVTAVHGPFTLAAEYVVAEKRFDAGQLEFNGKGARPSVWGVELAWELDGLQRPVTLAAAAQGSSEAFIEEDALELPRYRYLAGVSVALMDQLSLSFEYSHDRDYRERHGGTGDSANAFVVQLAAEF